MGKSCRKKKKQTKDNVQIDISHENDVTAQNISKNYPYAEWMLEEIKNEYAVENEREIKIGAKASAFITVIVAIITLYIPMIPFEKFREFMSTSKVSSVDMILTVIFIIVLIVGMIFLLIAFVFFIKAYGIKGYRRVRIDDLLNIANRTGEHDDNMHSYIAQGIVAHYHQILRGTLDEDGNMKTNSNSANCVTVGICLTMIGFIFLSIATIALRIIVVV